MKRGNIVKGEKKKRGTSKNDINSKRERGNQGSTGTGEQVKQGVGGGRLNKGERVITKKKKTIEKVNKEQEKLGNNNS